MLIKNRNELFLDLKSKVLTLINIQEVLKNCTAFDKILILDIFVNDFVLNKDKFSYLDLNSLHYPGLECTIQSESRKCLLFKKKISEKGHTRAYTYVT